jgi:hypothetical protein
LDEWAVVDVAPGEFQRVRFLVAVLHFAGHIGDETGDNAEEYSNFCHEEFKKLMRGDFS